MSDITKTISNLQSECENEKKQVSDKYKKINDVIQEKKEDLEKKESEWSAKGEPWMEAHKNSINRFIDSKNLEIEKLTNAAESWLKSQIERIEKTLSDRIASARAAAETKTKQREEEKAEIEKEKAKRKAYLENNLKTPIDPHNPIVIDAVIDPQEVSYSVYDV